MLGLFLAVAVAGHASLSGAAKREAAASGTGADPDRAAAAARRATGGTVLGVKRAGDQFRVRILTPAGRVTTVRVDAKSGKVIRR